jgi:hypothetical protein
MNDPYFCKDVVEIDIYAVTLIHNIKPRLWSIYTIRQIVSHDKK